VNNRPILKASIFFPSPWQNRYQKRCKKCPTESVSQCVSRNLLLVSTIPIEKVTLWKEFCYYLTPPSETDDRAVKAKVVSRTENSTRTPGPRPSTIPLNYYFTQNLNLLKRLKLEGFKERNVSRLSLCLHCGHCALWSFHFNLEMLFSIPEF